MRRRAFDADLDECRFEFLSDYRVVRLPPFCGQFDNGHCYPLDGSHG